MKLATLLLTLATISLQAQTPTLTGRWVATADFYGATRYMQLNLEQQGDKLTGKFNGDKLEGTLTGNAIHFLAKDDKGFAADVTGTIANGTIAATVNQTTPEAPPQTYKFTATIAPTRPTAAPQRHEFTPTVFYRSYSALNKPVLTINPGDTVHTTTVDAAGNDLNNVRRSAGGNPETGPFYIQSAMPGDILVVHINRLRLNRDSAISDDYVVESALNSNLAVKMKDVGKDVQWHLDLAKGTASPAKPDEHLAHYTVPLHPMLGCIATAVNPASAAPGTGDSGGYGGNMDFNEIAEDSTIYLPVSNPGALLYLGDAHAAMGDGEINGNALETSSDIEFTVDVIPNKYIRFPRVETPTHIIALGYSGSIDDAFRDATASMAQWLNQDYSLNPSEIAQVIGTAAEYKVTEVADRNSGIALKINKDRLAALTKTPPTKPN